jgi:hypothetical protein
MSLDTYFAEMLWNERYKTEDALSEEGLLRDCDSFIELGLWRALQHLASLRCCWAHWLQHQHKDSVSLYSHQYLS